MAKKETTQELKLKLVEYLLINGWEPNKEYRPSLIDERGCRELYGGGTEYYLISVNKDYAITIKTNVLTVHQASRNFCKVLSLNIADITYDLNGISSGLLRLNNPVKKKNAD